MKNNKILIAGLIGTVVAFFVGFLTYGMALNDFFESNRGSATGLQRADDEMIWWAMILGHLAFGMLLAIIYGRWANISTIATGAKAGAVLGALLGLIGFIDYAAMNVSNLTATCVNVIVMAIVSAITGAAVAWWLGRD